MIIKAIIVTCKVLACVCIFAAVHEAADRRGWALITDLVTALFFAALALCMGGVGL